MNKEILVKIIEIFNDSFEYKHKNMKNFYIYVYDYDLIRFKKMCFLKNENFEPNILENSSYTFIIEEELKVFDISNDFFMKNIFKDYDEKITFDMFKYFKDNFLNLKEYRLTCRNIEVNDLYSRKDEIELNINRKYNIHSKTNNLYEKKSIFR